MLQISIVSLYEAVESHTCDYPWESTHWYNLPWQYSLVMISTTFKCPKFHTNNKWNDVLSVIAGNMGQILGKGILAQEKVGFNNWKWFKLKLS